MCEVNRRVTSGLVIWHPLMHHTVVLTHGELVKFCCSIIRCSVYKLHNLKTCSTEYECHQWSCKNISFKLLILAFISIFYSSDVIRGIIWIRCASVVKILNTKFDIQETILVTRYDWDIKCQINEGITWHEKLPHFQSQRGTWFSNRITD